MTKAQNQLRTERFSDYFTWVKAVWVTARGKPLEFNNRKYLKEIYMNQDPHVVYTKSAQMGISERLISEAVWVCDQLGVVCLYTFPTQTHLADFVQARLDPVINMSDYLSSRVEGEIVNGKRISKVGLKRIGKGFLYLRGSSNEKQIITIDADCVILDERDRFSQENVPYIEKRLLASTLKWRREGSTPTYPGVGIHAQYLESDQRVWQVPCKYCLKWQEVDFFKNVDFDKKICKCMYCDKPLDRLQDGRWHKTNPDGAFTGFKISGMYNPNVTVEQVLKKYYDATNSGFSALQQFFNQDLGLPYETSGQSLSNQDLDNCKRDYLLPLNVKDNCFAGADVGVDKIHCVVVQKLDVNKYRIVWAGTVTDFFGPQNSLQKVIDTYNVKTMVIDKKPETQKVKELMEAYPMGRIYAATYPNMQFDTKEYAKFDDVAQEVRLDRTISLDYTINDIQTRKLDLPRNIESVSHFYDQLMSSVRITEKNERTGVESSRWIEKSDDHYLHALNYARVAQMRGEIGKALLDYYREPEQALTPNLIDWLRINGRRMM